MNEYDIDQSSHFKSASNLLYQQRPEFSPPLQPGDVAHADVVRTQHRSEAWYPVATPEIDDLQVTQKW